MPRRTRAPALPLNYVHETLRPWPCLVFLLPLVVVYEAGLFLAHPTLSPHQRPGLAARQLLEAFFSLFGATGYYLPGLALVAVLLAWHLASRQSWRVPRAVPVGMAAESVLWALPHFALNYVVRLQSPTHEPNTKADELILSIGAGIYEEMVFRLIIITLVIVILIDIGRVDQMWGSAIAIAVSSLLFAAHHYPPIGTDVFEFRDFAFRTAAGGYLACVYMFRGFGIAVGAHAMYNIIVVAILS